MTGSVRPSVRPSVRLSVCPSITPFSPCSHHRIIMKFSGVIIMDRGDVHAKGQGQRSKVKVTEVNTQLSRFRTLTPVWIHIWQWNHAHSWKQHGRGALLFSKVIRQISRSHSSKNRRIWPRLGISGLYLQFEFTNGYEMIHKAWSSIEEVPYCFPRWSVKFQGHTALKIVKFDPNWAFPDCNSSLNSSMGTKWCTKLEIALKMYPIVFQGLLLSLKVTRLKNIIDFDPNWAFPGCNSSLNSPMGMKWYTKLEIGWKRCPIVFQGHQSNLKVTRLKNHQIWPKFGVSRLTPVWIHQWLRNDAKSLK